MNNQTQTQTLPADKIIRALWYAWQLPELDRHQLTLSRCHDPLVTEAYAAILAGGAGLARLADQETAVSHLLDYVFNFAPSEGMLNMLRKRRKESGLPDDFFKRIASSPVMVWPEIDPGRGEWPKEPGHTCQGKEEGGAVITIRAQETAISSIIVPSWRDSETRPGCRGCQHKRTKREARKVLFELGKRPLWGLYYDPADFNRFAARTRQRRRAQSIAGAYAAYPLTDGRFYVIHDQESEGGQPISDDRTEVFNLLKPVVNDTPDDKRISTSGGWGGNWQGTKGDGRARQAKREGREIEPAFQVWSTEGVDRIVETLGGKVKQSTRSYTIKITAKEAFRQLAAAGVPISARGSNEQSLADFIKRFPDLDIAIGENGQLTLIHDRETAVFTDKGQGKSPEDTCPLCVNVDQGTAAPATDLQPLPLDFNALSGAAGGWQ